MYEMSVHEPGAQWLTPQDVDRDVRALSEALLEQRAERIARNVLRAPTFKKCCGNSWQLSYTAMKRTSLHAR